MYMHLFTRGKGGIANIKQDMLRTLEAISNYIVTDATDTEMFTLRVAREIFSNTSKTDIEQAIKKLGEQAEK